MLPTRNFSSVLRFLKPKAGKDDQDKGDADRRHGGRFKSLAVMCDLGVVTNLSGTGFRVQGKGNRTVQLNDRIRLTLKFYEHVVTVDAKVVWAKTLGRKKYEIGCELVDLTPRVREALTRMAMSAAPASTTPFANAED